METEKSNEERENGDKPVQRDQQGESGTFEVKVWSLAFKNIASDRYYHEPGCWNEIDDIKDECADPCEIDWSHFLIGESRTEITGGNGGMATWFF